MYKMKKTSLLSMHMLEPSTIRINITNITINAVGVESHPGGDVTYNCYS